MATDPGFVIVGSGRSGSGYIAAVLTAAGVRCGHEQWWNPSGEQTEGLDGDSSWCAATCLGRYQGVVLHQVRHPLRVVASFAKQPNWGPWADYLRGLVPQDAGQIATGVATCWALNYLSELRAVMRWRVEDVEEGLVVAIARTAGFRVDPPSAAAAVAAVPTDFNCHGPDELRLSWDDLPDDRSTERLHQMAARYGYE